MHLRSQFLNKQHEVPAELPESSAFTALLLKNYFAYLVYVKGREYHALVFNQQRVLRDEKGDTLISSIRGCQ